MPAPPLTSGIVVRGGVLVAVVAAVCGGAWVVWPKEADAAGAGARPPEQPAQPSPRSVGKAGCAAVACHGGAADLSKKPEPGCWQVSFTRWQAADPHTRAYEVLRGRAATDIMARLGWTKHATEDARCLACHTSPAYAADESQKHLRAEGVSCEACHGDSKDWLRPHTRWGGKPTDRHGMTDLGSVGVRAKICAGCHVGAKAEPGIPARDVNHDMIAAGHPRLVFDFAEHHRRLPRHWHEEQADESRLWRVGRVAAAEAACELLADRAGRKDPWPEFAEFNCASCHHPINPDASPKAGTPRWQSVWPVADVPELTAVRTAMERKRPTAAEVKAKAEAAAGELAKRREELAAKIDLRSPASDRDDLVFLLHGLAAVQRQKGGKPDERFELAFEAFRKWNPDNPERLNAEQEARRLVDELLRSR